MLVGGFTTLAREGIALLLGRHAPEMSIRATMSVGDAVGYLCTVPTAYDAALLSICGTDARDVDTIFRLARDNRTPPIVLMLPTVTSVTVHQLAALGIRGIADETTNGETLARVIRQAVAADTSAPAGTTWAETSAPVVTGPCGDLLRHCRRKLTAKQLEVLSLLGRGHGDRAIAEHLGLAEGTVQARVLAILRALGLENRAQAALLAARIGMIAVPLVGASAPRLRKASPARRRPTRT